MKVVALVSGGKDSCYAMMKCIQYGHQIVALANLIPADDATDELDSYMYQTVGHQIVIGYAKCMGLPLFRRRIQGSTRHHDLSYSMTPGDEVEDMFILLNEVKRQIPSVTAVSSGAIASDYQRLRVESICSRLGLVSLAYLWKQDQSFLLQEMITNGIIAILVKVAAIGLNPSKHLGKKIVELEPHLHKLKELYGINVCGEGGEYETLTLDCPLFKNARIVLDEFQIVLHSSDSIAPVGILHPLAFHLENKVESISSNGIDEASNVCQRNVDTVIEVQGDVQQGEAASEFVAVSSKQLGVTKQELKISKTRKDNVFSISCWLQDSCKNSSDLQEDLEVVLMKIEALLVENGSSWENVLYIHLYIADMDEFAVANETYVRYITQKKCRYGVPSRSTIELPLLLFGLGRAYIEVLVANDPTKKVLHVQSISCWAPSCIGPYSQATLHNDILHMAGQLGLDPATMVLCEGGPVAELEQALQNSEAVARSFNCSISTSVIVFVIYCSESMEKLERVVVRKKIETILKQMKSQHSEDAKKSEVLDPIFLYVLVPDLPKRALVEVKPMFYTGEYLSAPSDHAKQYQSTGQGYWGLGYETWHDICLQKSVVYGKICTAILSVTEELAAKICSLTNVAWHADVKSKSLVEEEQVIMIARFCIYRLDKVLLENDFSWDDVMNLRLYFASSLNIPHGTLSQIFSDVFNEFAQMSRRIKVDAEPILNIVPVLGAGRSLSTLDDIFTCELIASKC
ncbi:diphthine--ammonia ligase isoform X2 [Lycium ferocissimum]|uniref:diphthine--ammonia ligase isoform X2 n=1 Tax=Lycium ferocissimum TaxID=112874 RepID=UPI002815A586|nr:diphthine--ammonia ligase isoform X2 [Lycium ferocissimum]